ncbi:MAG: DUF2961 domain-containing protein [bacterium]|nr:DUF2961 domain-containing protein [bacterium]
MLKRFMRGLGVAALLAVSVVAAAQQTPQGDLMAELAAPKTFKALRTSSAQPDLTKNMDRHPIEPGKTLVLADLDGPGAITHIWCFAHTVNPLFSRALVIRIYWDGAKEPSVEAPLGDFFAVGHGGYADVDSAIVSVSAFGRSRNCFWNMPFRGHARITVTNESKEHRIYGFWYHVDWRKCDSLPADTPYFHARYQQEHPAKHGDYTILDTKGRGHYAGTVLSVHQTDLGWFGEGDERFYVDGEDYPSISGTGTEEYFGDAWGLRPYSRTFFGVPLFEGYYPGDRVSAYRWHVTDPIPFKSSLKMTIEHYGALRSDSLEWVGGFFERSDWLSSVAFWYQHPKATFEDSLPSLSERLAPYRIVLSQDLSSRRVPDIPLSEDGVYNPGVGDAVAEFDFEVSKAGCYQINAMTGRMFTGGRYQVFVDGRPAGPVRDYGFAGEDTAWDSYDLHRLDAGTHTLRFEGRGPSPNQRTLSPKRFSLHLDKLILLRLDDMAGYRSVALQRLGGGTKPAQ